MISFPALCFLNNQMVSWEDYPFEHYDNVKSQDASSSLTSQTLQTINSFERKKQDFMDRGAAVFVDAQPVTSAALNRVQEPSFRPLTSDMKYPKVQALPSQATMVPVPNERSRHSSSSTGPTYQPLVFARSGPRGLRTPEPVSAGARHESVAFRDFEQSGYASEGAAWVMGDSGRGSLTQYGIFGSVSGTAPASPAAVRSVTAGQNPRRTPHLPYRPQMQRYHQPSVDVAEYKV